MQAIEDIGLRPRYHRRLQIDAIYVNDSYSGQNGISPNNTRPIFNYNYLLFKRFLVKFYA